MTVLFLFLLYQNFHHGFLLAVAVAPVAWLFTLSFQAPFLNWPSRYRKRPLQT